MVPRPSTVSPVRIARSSGSQKQSESNEWPGVPHHVKLQAADREHVTVAEPLLAEPVRGVQRPDGRADQVGERARAAAVVVVAVGEQDRRDPRPSRWPATRRRWPSSSGPGSTTSDVLPGSPITQVLVPSRVIGDGFGASR